ncbi:MAG: EamA family transporter [Acidimicrobiia bacterium]|nr:EamA family transporter [Acidimicrobiia bacterium]
MPFSALAVVLAAAVLHAGWNLLLKASGDRLVAAAMQAIAGALVLAPSLIADGYPADRWPSLLASGVFHLGYGLTLVGAYERGDLSVVYPVARGTAPLVVAVGAAVFLDDTLGGLGVLGVVLIAGGILAVIRHPGRGIMWALACGGFIAGYSLVDGAAERAEGGSLRYTAALLLTNAVTLSVVALVRRGWRTAMLAARRGGGRQLLGGAASAFAYLLVLIAAREAPLGAVAAVRETSVVLGALGGWLLLGEPFGRARAASAAVIAMGLVLLVV